MATPAIAGSDLVVRLSPLEKLGAFRLGDVRVPLSSIAAARAVDDPWSELRGIRSPGTGLPGVIALGTRRGGFGKDFAAVYGKRPGVVIELDGADWGRIVLTTDDPAGTLRAIGR
ncbi:MAG TPA: hypothetical protein VMU75_15905 [Acidimicrobiales bacterium]|nr:hypothetical protein [Acidimicrobiales bacterium]